MIYDEGWDLFRLFWLVAPAERHGGFFQVCGSKSTACLHDIYCHAYVQAV